MNKLFLTLIFSLILFASKAQKVNYSDFCTIKIDSVFSVSGINDIEFPKLLTELVSNTLIAHQSEYNYKFIKNSNQSADLSLWVQYDFLKKSYGTMSKLQIFVKDNHSGKYLSDGMTHTFHQGREDTTSHLKGDWTSLLQQVQKLFGDELIPWHIGHFQAPLFPSNKPNYPITIGIEPFSELEDVTESEATAILKMMESILVENFQTDKMQWDKKANICPLYGEEKAEFCEEEKINVRLKSYFERVKDTGELEVYFEIEGDAVAVPRPRPRSHYTFFDLEAFRKNKHRANYQRLAIGFHGLLAWKVDW